MASTQIEKLECRFHDSMWITAATMAYRSDDEAVAKMRHRLWMVGTLADLQFSARSPTYARNLLLANRGQNDSFKINCI